MFGLVGIFCVFISKMIFCVHNQEQPHTFVCMYVKFTCLTCLPLYFKIPDFSAIMQRLFWTFLCCIDFICVCLLLFVHFFYFLHEWKVILSVLNSRVRILCIAGYSMREVCTISNVRTWNFTRNIPCKLIMCKNESVVA